MTISAHADPAAVAIITRAIQKLCSFRFIKDPVPFNDFPRKTMNVSSPEIKLGYCGWSV
jgi:hypothetical protein